MVSTQDSESCNPSSNLGGTLVFFLSALKSMRMEPGGRASISIKSGQTSPAIPCGLVVRIRRFHRRGRGSIPRMGEHFLATCHGISLFLPLLELHMPTCAPTEPEASVVQW